MLLDSFFLRILHYLHNKRMLFYRNTKYHQVLCYFLTKYFVYEIQFYLKPHIFHPSLPPSPNTISHKQMSWTLWILHSYHLCQFLTKFHQRTNYFVLKNLFYLKTQHTPYLLKLSGKIEIITECPTSS